MQNSIWKLTALAGVVGIGFLVVLQAQRGLSDRDQQANTESIPEAQAIEEGEPVLGSAVGEVPDSFKTSGTSHTQQAPALSEIQGSQSEPAMAEENPARSAQPADPFADFPASSSSVQTAQVDSSQDEVVQTSHTSGLDFREEQTREESPASSSNQTAGEETASETEAAEGSNGEPAPLFFDEGNPPRKLNAQGSGESSKSPVKQAGQEGQEETPVPLEWDQLSQQGDEKTAKSGDGAEGGQTSSSDQTKEELTNDKSKVVLTEGQAEEANASQSSDPAGAESESVGAVGQGEESSSSEKPVPLFEFIPPEERASEGEQSASGGKNSSDSASKESPQPVTVEEEKAGLQEAGDSSDESSPKPFVFSTDEEDSGVASSSSSDTESSGNKSSEGESAPTPFPADDPFPQESQSDSSPSEKSEGEKENMEEEGPVMEFSSSGDDSVEKSSSESKEDPNGSQDPFADSVKENNSETAGKAEPSSATDELPDSSSGNPDSLDEKPLIRQSAAEGSLDKENSEPESPSSERSGDRKVEELAAPPNLEEEPKTSPSEEKNTKGASEGGNSAKSSARDSTSTASDSKKSEKEAAGASAETSVESAGQGPTHSKSGFPPQSEEPARLPKAGNADDKGDPLQGDGTVDANAPRGPQRPELKIEKVAPENALLGKPMVYSILVTNVGNSAAYQVVVEDRIPKGSKLTGTIPRAEMVEKRLIWRLGTLKAGKQKKISVRVVPVAEGQIGSVATVNFVSEVAAETVVTAPRLKLNMSGPKQAELGKPVVFHFQIANEGSADASGVVLRDVIPEKLTHPDGNDLEYEIGKLPAGKTQDIKLTLTAAEVGKAVNKAVITAEGGLSIEDQSPVEIIGSQVTVQRRGPKNRFAGREGVYTDIIINDSDQTLSQVAVTEKLPEEMEFVKASAGGKYDESQHAVSWTIDKVEARGQKELKVTLIPRSGGTHTSVIQVSDAQGGQTEVESPVTVKGFTALSMEVGELEQPIFPGDQTTIQVQVRNRGTMEATQVQLVVTLPEETQFISAEGPVSFKQKGRELHFDPIQSVGADEKLAIDLQLKALKPGDARLQVQIQADQMQSPLNQEEPLLILGSQ